MTSYFTIGDIHGKFSMLKKVLKHWDGNSKLIFLGDLIDRGEDSFSVLKEVKSLVESHGALCLKGNHEYMFLHWLDNPSERYEHYQINGGDSTINSILGRPLDHTVDSLVDSQKILCEHKELVDFIRQMPYYYETNFFIFVHAGLDLSLENWKDTTEYQNVWIRQPFFDGVNTTGKTILFGHTPIYELINVQKGSHDLYLTFDKKIGLDGGAVYGGVLHGLVVSEGEIVSHNVIEYE